MTPDGGDMTPSKTTEDESVLQKTTNLLDEAELALLAGGGKNNNYGSPRQTEDDSDLLQSLKPADVVVGSG